MTPGRERMDDARRAGSAAPGGPWWRLTGRAVRYLVLAAAAAVMIFPLIWMVLAAMRPGPEVRVDPLAWPDGLTLEPFVRAWRVGRFGRHFLSSLVVSSSSVAIILLCGSMAGFALARFPIRGAGAFTGLLLVGFLLPLESIVLSLAGLTEMMGINDTWPALIGPYVAIELPLAVFIYRSFFVSIPQSLHEAAILDGATTWQVYWRVFLPLAGPVTAVVGIVAFLAVWNEFLLATLLITEPEWQTMPAAFSAFYGRRRADLQLILAGLTVYVLPAVAVYLAFNRRISHSVTQVTLKG